MGEVWIVLDVDGVINRLSSPEERGPAARQVWSDRDQCSWWIDPDLEVLGRIDMLVRRPRVRLAWLTTWGHSVHAITDHFHVLKGGRVLAERPTQRFVPADWKLTALLTFLEERENPPYVWADDDAVPDALTYRAQFKLGRAGGEERLLLGPDPCAGLTCSDVTSMESFVDTILGRGL